MKKFYGWQITLFAAVIVQATRTPTFDPMVAFICNKGAMHMDPDNGWVKDSHNDCKHEINDILNYCKRMYPTLNITNVVETSEPMEIKGWCPLGVSSCATPDTAEVQPYRCLSGAFQSDALIQPDGCHFSFKSKAAHCESHSFWRRKAREACATGNLTHLSGYAMLEPCGLDKWSGVEYVCCPKSQDDAEMPAAPIAAIQNSIVSRYMRLRPRAGEYINEHEVYELAKKELKKDNHDRITELMKIWAEKRKARLQSQDPRPAEDSDDGISEKYGKDLLLEQERGDKSLGQLDKVHQEHVQVNFNHKKRVTMQKLLQELKAEKPNEANIGVLLKHYIQEEEKDGQSCIRHFVKVRSRDPEQAEGMLPATIEHLHLISLRINQSIDLLETLTDKRLVERIKEDVWAYVLESPLKIDLVMNKLTVLSQRQTTASTGHVTFKDADVPPPRLPPSEELIGGEGHQFSSQPKQDSSMEATETSAASPTKLPFVTKDEPLNKKLSAAPSIAIAAGIVAAMMIVVLVILMVKTKSRRKRKGHTYLEVTDGSVDLSPEDRHIAAMQHGFENPTYALLEQRKL